MIPLIHSRAVQLDAEYLRLMTARALTEQQKTRRDQLEAEKIRRAEELGL